MAAKKKLRAAAPRKRFTPQPAFYCTYGIGRDGCKRRAIDGCQDCGIGRCAEHREQGHDPAGHRAPSPRKTR